MQISYREKAIFFSFNVANSQLTKCLQNGIAIDDDDDNDDNNNDDDDNNNNNNNNYN
jgi:hypothetical protein